MKAPTFKKWFAQVPALNQPQRLQTLAALHPAAGLDQLLALDCILVARDRSGQTIDAVVGRGALKAAQLERHLLPWLDRHCLLVSDANAAYRAFSRQHGIAHQAVILGAGERVRHGLAGAIHVQHVNAYHHRFRQWLARFNG